MVEYLDSVYFTHRVIEDGGRVSTRTLFDFSSVHKSATY